MRWRCAALRSVCANAAHSVSGIQSQSGWVMRAALRSCRAWYDSISHDAYARSRLSFFTRASNRSMPEQRDAAKKSVMTPANEPRTRTIEANNLSHNVLEWESGADTTVVLL